MDSQGKKNKSIGTPYRSDNTCSVLKFGIRFPFSHATNVLGLTRSVLATSACVISAFTLAAAKLNLTFSK
nr:MAG TPA: hypothetical protein [Caudoviricetes sp.]